EPWNRWMSNPNVQGQAPSRPWDPLQFVIDECRRRGMEIHAWFNPYRAGVSQSLTYHATHPLHDESDIVVAFESSSSDYWWFNPGHPDTADYTMDVILDVVTRYDIDAIHFDDYFYPYGISTPTYPFPDATEFALYGSPLTLANWRRKNVDDFLAAVKGTVQSIPGKEHVRFGVSPFGIWKSGTPTGISGLSAYDSLFADSKKWIEEGYVDYLAPQLYWGRVADGYSSSQSFDALLNWWTAPAQNALGRHVYAGIEPARIVTQSWPAAHIVSQITYTQSLNPTLTVSPATEAFGNIHFRALHIMNNNDGIATSLASGVYAVPATAPATNWLDAAVPTEPVVAFTDDGGSYTAYWTPAGSKYPQWYIVYWQDGANWEHAVVPDWQRKYAGIPGSASNIAVQALDRVGNRSATTPISLAGASPNPVPTQFASTDVRNFDSSALAFNTGSGSNDNMAGSPRSSANSTEEYNNRLDPRAGDPGSTSSKNVFQWSGSSGGRYRLTTTSAAPMVDYAQGFGVYFKLLEGELDISLALRETGDSGPIGGVGTTSGAIERTSNLRRLTASPNWQYMHFDMQNEAWTSFASGNGAIPATGFGVFESFLIYQVAGSALPSSGYMLYIDDIHQGGPHTPLGEPLAPMTASAATAPGDWGVDLAWGASSAQDLKGYRIYRSTSPSVALTSANLVTEVTGNSHTDTNLTPAGTYYYVVTAVDHFGYESLASPEVSASASSVPVELDLFDIQ
ncbi:MAG: family 10 glycosylhydrolase, partial [Candidatus Sumerlaeia bacterium]|nr:family 10 glycosylhydrolase [Candidatus Sumerlaeia bacterium]